MYNPVVWLILTVLNIYWWVVIAAVVASWLVAFGVINMHNQIVYSIVKGLTALTEPVFRQVRRVVPTFGGLDISPVIVLIAISFLQYAIVWATLRYFA